MQTAKTLRHFLTLLFQLSFTQMWAAHQQVQRNRITLQRFGDNAPQQHQHLSLRLIQGDGFPFHRDQTLAC
ncbi:Uncharacterised protein [Vibrio cholerae]|nr:Uncharacterised protein [Vibrio cholerae]CSD55631.1 Uncharacterised protein [Vibrio cholerae]CSI66670.1 Uncharacterised protein [Vibrio cholerae]